MARAKRKHSYAAKTIGWYVRIKGEYDTIAAKELGLESACHATMSEKHARDIALRLNAHAAVIRASRRGSSRENA